MSYSGSGNTGGGASNAGRAWRNDGGVQPHAFDPNLQPELFRGVLVRRIFAFLIDLVVLSVPVILGYLFIAVFGLITLGLGWALNGWLAGPRSSGYRYYGASRRTAFSDGGHARDGSGTAHPYGASGCARRHPRGAAWVSICSCRRMLLVGLFNGAAAGCCRRDPGNHHYQQLGPTRSAGGTKLLRVESRQTD